jgi:hypothetical protein
MALKAWEKNLEESKKLAKEAKNACLNALLDADVEMAEIDIGDIHSFIGKVEIEKRNLNMKKKSEGIQNSISQVNHANLQVLHDLLVKQSLQYQITQQAVVKIQRNLPLVHKKVFTFELNANIEPPPPPPPPPVCNFIIRLTCSIQGSTKDNFIYDKIKQE